MKKPFAAALKHMEVAVLVGIVTPQRNKALVSEHLDELAFLTKTAGATPLKKFIQQINVPNPGSLIGSGKLKEIKEFIGSNKIDMVIFDEELSASQFRNLEKGFERKILDRTNLILDIFAKHAKTSYAKIQVELAQYQYLLPRLTGMWTHLERQRGGIGLRGPGETEIETDRRVIRSKIARLKAKLKKIDSQMAVQRKRRSGMVRVSLIGYTNTGKSTLMNVISKSDLFTENKLFATLDTSVRRVNLDKTQFLISDTVGFIRKLPHQLVESFKSTLDEVRESDILLHVVDISHPGYHGHMDTVYQTLHDIGISDKPILTVFNKIDAFNGDTDTGLHKAGDNKVFTVNDLKNTWIARKNSPCVFISALQKTNLDELKKKLLKIVKKFTAK